MPVYMIPNGKLPATVVTVAGDFKPGDPPPTGYNDWHEWAAVQTKSGLKQVRCGRCSLWKFPQELTGRKQTNDAAPELLIVSRQQAAADATGLN